MHLSIRAQQYIQRQVRNKHWLTIPRIIDFYLKRQKATLTPELLSFQENYSGFILTIRGKIGSTFNAMLFSASDIIWNRKIELSRISERYVVDCGTHATAQFSFFITNKGEICTWEEDNYLNIVYSSFDKFVEGYALCDELSTWCEHSGYYDLLNNRLLDDYVHNSYELIEECSDAYNAWWTDNNVAIRKGVWLDRPGFYIHVYARTERRGKTVMEELKKAGIVK